MSRKKNLATRLLRGLILGCGTVSVTALLFEGIYRFQLIDTYRPELRAFNSAEDLAGGIPGRTILVMGDSFTAGNATYPAVMRAALPGYRVINSGLTATGIMETSVIARRRFGRFAPSVFIYQLYVGNDLFNIKYPVNWGRVSLARNLYWVLAEQLRSVGYLNYRAGQHLAWLRGTPAKVQSAPAGAGSGADPTRSDCEEGGPFAVDRYRWRERLYLQADPHFLENQIMVGESRAGDYAVMLEKLGNLLALCDPPVCSAFLLVIPDACQVHPSYLDHVTRLGATFHDPQAILRDEYPFIEGIRRYLEDHGMDHVRVVNPARALRDSEARGVRVYYQNDPHLCDRGQRLLAEVLLDNLHLEGPRP